MKPEHLRTFIFIFLLVSAFSVSGVNALYKYRPELNSTIAWNTQSISSGINREVRSLCPTDNITNMVYFWEKSISEVKHTNSTGNYFYFPIDTADVSNLSMMKYDHTYDITSNDNWVWTCPCEVTYDNEDNPVPDDNFIYDIWKGGYCDLLDFTPNADGYEFADCIGVEPRQNMLTYHCPQTDVAGNCVGVGWQVFIPTDVVGSSLQEFRYGMDLYIDVNDSTMTDNRINFTYGIQCEAEKGASFYVNLFDHDTYQKAFGADFKVFLYNADTNKLIEAGVDNNGVAVFNLTTKGWWGVYMVADGYSQVSPEPLAEQWFDPVRSSGVNVFVHYIESNSNSLTVHVCEELPDTIEISDGEVLTVEELITNGLINQFLPGKNWKLLPVGTLTSTRSGQTDRCSAINNVIVSVSGNFTGDGITGDSGTVQFFDINNQTAVNTVRIAVNKSGYDVIAPKFNSTYQLTNDENHYVVWVAEVGKRGGDGGLDDEATQEAEEIAEAISETNEWFNSLIPDDTKTMIWMIITTLSSAGLSAMTHSWEIGAILMILLTLTGAIVGWLPSWVAILFILIAGFIFVKMTVGVGD